MWQLPPYYSHLAICIHVAQAPSGQKKTPHYIMLYTCLKQPPLCYIPSLIFIHGWLFGIGQWSLSFSFLLMLLKMMLSFLVCWYRMVAVAAERYQAGLERGMKQTDAWNASSCDWIAAAIVSNIVPCITFWRPLPTDLYYVHIITILLQAHCHYIVLKAFHEAVQNSAMTTPSNIGIVNALCTLYATFGVMKYSGDFMMVCNAHVFVWEISK